MAVQLLGACSLGYFGQTVFAFLCSVYLFFFKINSTFLVDPSFKFIISVLSSRFS